MHNPEPYVQGALDYLRDHLSDALATIDEREGDFELPVPTEDKDYSFGVVDSPLRYPVIDSASPDWEMTDFDIDSVSAAFQFSIIVRAQLRDTDYDRLSRSLYRYGEAMVACLVKREALPDHATVVAARGAFRINPETEEREQLIGRCVLGLTIEHSVDFE
jgi:hypothetical protein